LRLLLNTLLRLVTGTYFVLTSIYCLLAFLPYTFFFLIKAPPYAWMPWFVQHQAASYFVATGCAVFANWWTQKPETSQQRRFQIGVALLLAAGIYLSFHPFLGTLQDNSRAYGWSLVALLFLGAIVLWGQFRRGPAPESDPGGGEVRYSVGVLAACIVSLVYAAGSRLRVYSETGTVSVHWADAELTLWSLISHVVLGVVIVSAINLIFLLAARTARPQWSRRVGVSALVLVSLWVALARFLENALSFAGWPARIYAGALALALTLWGFSIVRPFLDRPFLDAAQNNENEKERVSGLIPGSRIPGLRIQSSRFSIRTFAAVILLAAAAFAIAFPYLVHGADWSGFLEGTRKSQPRP